MKFALQKLEETENMLKETIYQLSERNVDASVMKTHLEEVQTAILVLNSSQEIINIGRILALKNFQK